MRKTTLLITAALALCLALPAAADTVLKMTSQTDAFQVMGQNQPAQDAEITYWIGEDRALRDDGETATLLKDDTLYVLNHAEKSYSVLELPVDLSSLLPDQNREQMEQMLQAMEMTATVEPTDEEKEINGYSARRYDVVLENQMGMKIESTVWATEELDVDLESFHRMSKAMASLQPGGAAMAEELLRVAGVPVLMETRIQGMGGSTEAREELISAETKDAPPETYEVPEGYREREFNPMPQSGGGM
ncbi:MAG: DUF4412 domain-containing protein [Thermoanaerobaculia bacterium]